MQGAYCADDGFFSQLFALSTAALDYELRSIPVDRLVLVFTALTAHLGTHRDFEATQAVLSVLLRVHADLLLSEGMEGDEALDEPTLDALEKLLAVQEREAARFGKLVGLCLGSLSFVRGVV